MKHSKYHYVNILEEETMDFIISYIYIILIIKDKKCV